MRTCPACGARIDDDAAHSCTGGAVAGATPVTQVVAAGEAITAPPSPHGAQYLPGTLLQGRYRIIGPLGKGGMGEVYSAEDLRLGQTVALKFLPAALARDHAARERFYAEVRIGRQVSHPNVCRLYDLVEIDGHPCLAMEHVDGEDLATLLRRIGRLPVDKAIDLARDVAAGLAAVHDKGVVHRDLKPANIMVDGRGRARLTDFGIAALAVDAAGEEGLVGTLAYLAPEQLDGAPATTQTDLYALGLVLMEAFTGTPVYAPRSVHELRDLQAQTTPPNLSSRINDVPREVERVLQRCLERDPAERPETALEVLATLPGGDPLQAALAAGETPTPAMVAAAGTVGDVPVSTAWMLLLWVVAAMLGIAMLSTRSTQIGRIRPEIPTPVLAAKAQEVLAAIGVARPRVRKDFYDFDTRVLQSTRMSGARAADAGTAALDPLRFVLRGADRPLVARQRAQMLFLPAELGRVTMADPPMDTPGQSWVVLDSQGRLLEYLVVPPRFAAGAAPPADVDWSKSLAATGLDAATLREVPPRRNAPVDTDRKRAWTGAYPGAATPVHVEAASLQGRPVFFSLRDATAADDRDVPDTPAVRIALWVTLAMGTATLVVVLSLARRNLRQGRGDRRGAGRLGAFLFVSLFLGLLVRADRSYVVVDEIILVMNIFAQAATFALLAALQYLAFEPVARRTWPRLMIAWTRLLDARWRDPLVGRDVLLGMLAGLAMVGTLHVATVVPSGFGHTQLPPLAQVVSTLNSTRQVIHFALTLTYFAVGFPIFASLALFLLKSLVKRMPVAHLAMFAFFALIYGTALVYVPLATPALIVFTAIWYGTFARLGWLAAGVALYVAIFIQALPLTLDSELWYADRTWLGLGFLLAVAVLAFRNALGGKSPLPTAWLGK